MPQVTLRDITDDNWMQAARIEHAPEQAGFVAGPMEILALAYVGRHRNARAQAICAQDKLVGLLLVEDLAQEILPKTGKGEIPRDYGAAEQEAAAESTRSVEMEVSTPIFQLGCKADVPPKGEQRLRQKLIGGLVCESLLGTSSPLYARLYAGGLINSSFSYGYEDYPGCAFLAAGGESANPEAVRDAVLSEAGRIGREGIAPGLWKRLKKAAYGNQVRALNSFEHLCVEQAQSHFAEVEFLRFPEVFESIQKSDAEDCIRRWFDPKRVSLSVVRPKAATA